MSSIRVRHQTAGSNITHNPLEIKTVRADSGSAGIRSQSVSEESATSYEGTDSVESSAPEVQVSDAERRAQRREEYKEAALIKERALKIQREAEDKIRQAQQFSSLIDQAKEDPTVLAKALGLSPEELQRKMFNKMYSIKEDPAPVKEESFEEQTKRRLAEYESERAQEKERRAEEARRSSEENFQKVKHNYINNNILPLITENHEFIHRNDKYSCAAVIYDLMNAAYQEAASTGKDFTLKAEDVINQMEEELERRAADQLTEAKNIKKLQKYFQADQDRDDFVMPRKTFGHERPVYRQERPTLSNSIGSSVPPSVSSLPSSSMPDRRVSFSDRNARRERAKRNLGG